MSPRDHITAAATAAFLSAAPAGAAELRGSLGVRVEVVTSCRAAAARPRTACSHPMPVRTTTAARADERPLDEAAALLGAPVRGARGVRFTAPVRRVAAETEGEAPAAAAILFHTISY